ncbi:MAG: glycoside hydrolase family 3 N-terminal domain-containing protein [Conexibacter sp.]
MPTRASIRRRRAALLAAVMAALLAGVVVGAGRGDDTGGAAPATAPIAPAPDARARARADVARMPLTRQVGELLVIAFSGTSAPGYVLDALHDGRVAGVILFGGNAPSPASVRALTASLRRASRAGGNPPPIVCLDQEGGAIRTLRFAPSAVSQAAQPTTAAARAAATATARALRRVGVNVVLGPVADVAANAPGSGMASRANPRDAAAVAAATRAATSAYLRAGVLPVLKHFPGLSGATTNTDDAAASIRRTRAQLASDLLPFRQAIDAGAPLVMLDHARYPALDPTRIASQSRAIATGLLRGRLRFDGVTMTDSLEARAALATTGGDVGEAAVRSLTAGADLLLTTGPGSFPLVRDAVVAAARRSAAVRARVADAAARVLALRRAQLGG